MPYRAIATSLPFYAILFAHMGQNYGYETLMTELPTYMKQVLRFSIKEVSAGTGRRLFETGINTKPISLSEQQNGVYSALPYLAMWICSIGISFAADWMTISNRFSQTTTRKIINSIGM